MSKLLGRLLTALIAAAGPLLIKLIIEWLRCKA